MISAAQAQEMSREAATKAAREKQQPFYFWPEDAEDDNRLLGTLKKIPFIGTYLPPGWRRVDLESELSESGHGIYAGDAEGYGAYFVDSSGFGAPYERALTVKQFLEKIKQHLDVAYAIVEAGEFQVKIGCFQKLR